ncbi:unnamed protein product [Cuscuta campestris]|uniref:Uncharacterized protein n=1 Tax=Cuscuta campestris TaxID=132261 RepID=A0A484M1W0_9ASTE|nr:unnamed protein product [Cuscuta campestris]
MSEIRLNVPNGYLLHYNPNWRRSGQDPVKVVSFSPFVLSLLIFVVAFLFCPVGAITEEFARSVLESKDEQISCLQAHVVSLKQEEEESEISRLREEIDQLKYGLALVEEDAQVQEEAFPSTAAEWSAHHPRKVAQAFLVNREYTMAFFKTLYQEP